ncbi:Collagen alpha-2(VI) chain [Liparis tanakae]|uniref:Collagen alpha-2(VI) chain n=1 Tax=Liparis tanakae TaxID=230148 RepID=A0A4Z2J367_9TELE|nr:Collagen alpha-2(VI) chain [Liparis tanakae]
MTYIRETCGCCDCEKRCGALDIVFVIDSSESVGLTNFTLEKNFVINTINRLGSMASDPASSTGTRVGVVQFSHNGTFEAIRLDDPKVDSMSAFKTAVKKLQWIAGGTFTPSALKFAYDNLIRDGKRAQAKVSVVVITDGRFDPRDDEDLLNYLCDNGVVVNAIGIGDMFQKEQDDEILVSIACKKKERVTGMKRYVDLVAEDFIEKMESVLCPDPVVVCPDLPCKREPEVAPCSQRPVDLVFLLDGSERLGVDNFRHVGEFVQKVADGLGLADSDTDRMRARLALVEFGNETENRVAFPLTHDAGVIATGIERLTYHDSSSSVGPAILYAIDNILGKGNGRKTRRNAEVSFVFITDGVTDSNDLAEAVSAMRGAQVVSTVIATRSDVDQQVLMQLAMDDKDAIFKGKDFSDLSVSSLFDRFIQWLLFLLHFCERKLPLHLLEWTLATLSNDLRALESSLQPCLHGGKRGAGVHCPMMQTLEERVGEGCSHLRVAAPVIGVTNNGHHVEFIQRSDESGQRDSCMLLRERHRKHLDDLSPHELMATYLQADGVKEQSKLEIRYHKVTMHRDVLVLAVLVQRVLGGVCAKQN